MSLFLPVLFCFVFFLVCHVPLLWLFRLVVPPCGPSFIVFLSQFFASLVCGLHLFLRILDHLCSLKPWVTFLNQNHILVTLYIVKMKIRESLFFLIFMNIGINSPKSKIKVHWLKFTNYTAFLPCHIIGYTLDIVTEVVFYLPSSIFQDLTNLGSYLYPL